MSIVKMQTVGHGLFAGFLGDGNAVIDCYHPASGPVMGARVVVQRADLPDLLRVLSKDAEDRPATAPDPDENERAFWCAAFCAAIPTRGGIDDCTRHAEEIANAALVEYRKRWGAK